jgi:hypothetical protein
VAVILIRIERQQSDEKDCHNNDNCGAHIFGYTLKSPKSPPGTLPRRPSLKKLGMLITATPSLCR